MFKIFFLFGFFFFNFFSTFFYFFSVRNPTVEIGRKPSEMRRKMTSFFRRSRCRFGRHNDVVFPSKNDGKMTSFDVILLSGHGDGGRRFRAGVRPRILKKEAASVYRISVKYLGQNKCYKNVFYINPMRQEQSIKENNL